MKPKQMEQLVRNVPGGVLGISSLPRNRRVIQYELHKKRKHLVLAGEDSQNTMDMLYFLSNIVKDSAIKPLERYVLMPNETREMIYSIDNGINIGQRVNKCCHKSAFGFPF